MVALVKNTFVIVAFSFLHSIKTLGSLWNLVNLMRISLLLDGLFDLDFDPLEITGARWPRLDFSPFKGNLSSRYKTWNSRKFKRCYTRKIFGLGNWRFFPLFFFIWLHAGWYTMQCLRNYGPKLSYLKLKWRLLPFFL